MLALRSILNTTYSKKNLEIIIVGSILKDALEKIECIKKNTDVKIEVINLKHNTYPSIARVVGFLRSKGKYILSMDDDCVLDKNTINELVKVMIINSKVGGVGPAVHRYSDKKIQYSGALITPVFIPLRVKDGLKTIYHVEFIPGTITMFNRGALEKSGLWDYVNFPWHAEDADLCVRLRKKGFLVSVVPYVKAYHLKTALIDVSSAYRAYFSGRSRIIFYRRHLSKWKFVVYFLTVNIAIIMFYAMYLLFKKRSLAMLREYIRGVVHGLTFKIVENVKYALKH